MAHQPGWIELYGLLEEGGDPPADLVELCKAGRTEGTRETMLHWYVIEGEPAVVQRLIELGWDVDALDAGGNSPLLYAALMKKWEMVRVLRRARARVSGVNTVGWSYRSKLCEAYPELPSDLRGDAYKLEDLLLPGGPEERAVTSVYLTRSGLPPDAPGQPLDRASWTRFVTQDPELEMDTEIGDQLAWAFSGAECVSSQFSEDIACGPVPGIRIDYSSGYGMRLAYRIAQHFGARVLWEFECGPEPHIPG